VALGPIADGAEVDRDHRCNKRPRVAERHRLGDIGAEFKLVLDELRRERGTVAEFPDILGAVDDDEMASLVAPVTPKADVRTEPLAGGIFLASRCHLVR
jgi:hypothetical protein